jgi:hypothetical protein
MFMTDQNYAIRQATSQFFAAQMLTKEWVQPIDRQHEVYKAASDIKDADGHVLVTAYAVKRPDDRWGLMLINKDYDHAHDVKITFNDGTAKFFSGTVDVITFGKAQYQWHPARRNGYADPDGPARKSTVQGGANAQYALPAASVTVLRGKVE